MIVILDYGVGNLSSVRNMLSKAGGEAVISGDPTEVLAAKKLLIPGVGHFDHGMRMLNNSGLRDVLDEFALELRRPVLGICLGAQILGNGSEEGDEPGLGWIDMVCRKLPASRETRVPHMGWNRVKRAKPFPILDFLDDESRFYFVHSFYMDCIDGGDVLSTTEHGIEFTSAVQKNNIIGTQFHPEKSLRHGLALLREFVGFTMP